MRNELSPEVKKLTSRQPMPGVVAALRDLDTFPVGLLDEQEIQAFANAKVALEEAWIIALKKGIALGRPIRKPSFWDKFRRFPKDQSVSKEEELKYKGLPIRLLDEGDTSVASSFGCSVASFKLNPNLGYEQYGNAYYLPDQSGRYLSDYGNRFIMVNKQRLANGKSSIMSLDTLIQIVEHKGMPVLIINRAKPYKYTEAVAAYTIEPSDQNGRIYHIHCKYPDESFIVEINMTDKKGTFLLRTLKQNQRTIPASTRRKQAISQLFRADISNQRIFNYGRRFMFLEKAEVVEPGKKAAAQLVDRTLPEFVYLNDHFPGRPIFPGALLTEAMAQLSGIALISGIANDAGTIGVLRRIKDMEFNQIIEPKDLIRLEAEIIRFRAGVGISRVAAFKEGVMAARGELVFVLVPNKTISE